MKLDVKKYPIYGANLNNGQIEIFQEAQEALDFFTQRTELDTSPGKIQLRPRLELDKPIPTFLINDRNNDDNCIQPIMSIEI
ncbi:MAG: hypothetical protein VX619_05490 [bacterium]|nr:hypothetical protein [bacterium]